MFRLIYSALVFLGIGSAAAAQSEEVADVAQAKESPTKVVQGKFDAPRCNVDFASDLLKVGTWSPLLDGRPKGWDDLSAFDNNQGQVARPGGQLNLYSIDYDSETTISTTIDLPDETELLTFLVRLRGLGIERGDAANAGGGVTFSLIDYQGHARVLPRIDPRYQGYRNWLARMHTVRVLDGETKLQVKIALVNAVGTLDVDDIFVFPVEAHSMVSEEDQNVLIRAIQQDDAETVATLIQKHPQLLENRTSFADSGTPLTVASWYDSAAVAEKLIELGADIEAEDYNWHNTPLRWCCFWGNDKVAEVLVKAGAKTAGASAMAQSSKTSNQATRRTAADYDRISEMIEQHTAGSLDD